MTNRSQWEGLANEMGPAFAARAEKSDRDGSFVAQNYEELKARKVFSAGVPRDLGGGGATHAELCSMIRTLAHHCPSTALALSMHTHLVATAVWRHLHGQPAAPLLQRVAKEELVLVSTGATDWLSSVGTAKKVEGGYRVSGLKRFASGSPSGDLALTSIPFGDEVFHFAVSLKAEGVKVGSDWDTLGMRATGSHTLSFEDVFVPDAAISVRRPRGQWHPSLYAVVVIAVPIYLSAYIGVAEQAAALVRAARKGSGDPLVQSQVGELETELHTARLALDEMIAAANNYDVLPTLERSAITAAGKTVAARAVRKCLDVAVATTGGGAFYKKNPIERLWRDAQGVQFHPMPEVQQLLLTGKVALGAEL